MKITWQAKSKIDKAGVKVIQVLQKENFQAFWVGGAVRNILLKIPSNNIDIATDALPDDVEKILNDNKIYNKPVGKKFGSILAIVNSFPIEITTFRAEGRYSDNRHPDQVQFIKDYLADAKRRDFTINALYFDPINKQLYDTANGIKDLKLKLIKFVGDPKKRIDEDALRMLRAVRLATVLGFKLEKNAFAAIKTRAKYIQDTSGERVKAELDKILLSENLVQGIKLLAQTGLLKFISPQLDGLQRIFHKSKIYHLEGSVFVHTLLVTQALKLSELNLKYAALFHDVGKISTGKKVSKEEGWVISFHGHVLSSVDIFNKFAEKFKFSKYDRESIVWLIRFHDYKKVFYDLNLKQQVQFASHDNFNLLLDIWQADSAGNIKKPENNWFSKPRQKAYNLGISLLKKIAVKKNLIRKLAKGDLIMKYSTLKPGRKLGKKIEDIKAEIVLGGIKNEKDLKGFLALKST